MSKQRFTPEEIARSLRVCHGAAASCEGCICADGRVQRSPVECRELETLAADLIEEQAKRIAELEEQARWIPVSERLPDLTEAEKRRIIWDDYAAPVFIAMIKGAKVPTALYFDGEYWYDSDGAMYAVTHWKPMPEGLEVGT